MAPAATGQGADSNGFKTADTVGVVDRAAPRRDRIARFKNAWQGNAIYPGSRNSRPSRISGINLDARDSMLTGET
ncbi:MULTISPECIES: hypothetical protein [unclassified Burkholderia]|uniref:hypothetical protein n=1 Tax=unclassified Burkholderia TaxID=2613784 RepID=UPI000F5AE545|nr:MULTISPECIES: hypothetical protein [unclassified Burkholderia]